MFGVLNHIRALVVVVAAMVAFAEDQLRPHCVHF